MPNQVRQLKPYFRNHSLDITAPCSSSVNSITDTNQHCWVVRNLSVWNGFLHAAGFELKESFPGKLTLQTFERCSPSTSKYRAVCASLVSRLLNDHSCVRYVDLGYTGELFGPKSRILSLVIPNNGIEHVSLRGRQMSKLESCKLVKIVLRGDPSFVRLHALTLRPAELSLICKNIVNESRLCEIELLENGLKGGDAIALLDALERSARIECLRLEFNTVGVRGAQRFAEFLRKNKTLLNVSLFKAKIRDKGAVYIGAALMENTTLRSLKLGANAIGPEGALALATALKVNKSLVILDLRDNGLGVSGATFLADMLAVNESLQEMHICANAISDAGIVAVAESLMSNKTLLTLSLHANEFGEVGVAALAHLLSANKTLVKLNAASKSNFSAVTQFGMFTEALSSNRSLEGVELSVWCTTAMQQLSWALRLNQTLRHLSLCTYVSEIDLLFRALAENKSVEVFELHCYMSVNDGKAFMTLLETTKTIHSVTLSNRVSNTCLLHLVRGLTANTSIWHFRIASFNLRITVCRAIAFMFHANSTLNCLVIDRANADEACLETLAEGLASNLAVQVFSLNYPPSSAGGFKISESLRRNISLMNRAMEFALNKAADRVAAEAFQIYGRSPLFVEELSKLVRPPKTFNARCLIREAERSVLRNFFVITGVVKTSLVCNRLPKRKRRRTQLDQLHVYCMDEILSYLKVSDVRH